MKHHESDQPEVTAPADGMTDYGLVELRGTENTRDQGGMASVTGQRVRAKKLFRSDALHSLTDEDIKILVDECNVRTVLDLRTPAEQKVLPDPQEKMPGVRFVQLPVLSNEAIGITHEHDLKLLYAKFKDLEKDPIEMVSETYPKMLLGEAGKAAYRSFFNILLEQEEGAVLWHCSEGKDRTGMASILILHVLGVPPETIMEDYLATNIFADLKTRHLAAELEKHHIAVKSDRALLALQCAHTEYVEAAMNAVRAKYGSFDNYITEALGIDAAKREILADKYLF